VIYVDELKKCQPRDERDGGRWRWKNYCHLFSDADDHHVELHVFAIKLKLKRDYFQDLKGFPHYDLTATKRRLAVKLGAVPISSREMAQRVNAALAAKGMQKPTLQFATPARP